MINKVSEDGNGKQEKPESTKWNKNIIISSMQ